MIRHLLLVSLVSTALGTTVVTAQQLHGARSAEIDLPAGMRNDDDDEESGDPRGLPRMLDYEIRSVSKHTVSGTDQVIVRVETREYRLGRYSKRPPSAPAEILKHYRRQLEVIGGSSQSQSPSHLSGRFLWGDLSVQVTLQVEDNGKRYEIITAYQGVPNGDTGIVVSPTHRGESRSGKHTVHPHSHIDVASKHAATSGGSASAETTLVDRSSASTSFSMPSRALLWPPRGTRGMAVLLVGPGVHRATAIRFGTSDGEIIARENARVRVRVPLLPAGNVPVTLVEANGSERLKDIFQILEAPPIDAAATTVPPCDARPSRIADINEISPQPVRPGQLLKLAGRSLDRATHVTFTVAKHEIDPQSRGIDPDLVGINLDASGKARSAPRWLDTLAVNIGRSYGARPSEPGECDSSNISGYAAIKVTGDREGVVCVPPLALTGPIGVWGASEKSGDYCDTSEIAVQIRRTATAQNSAYSP